MRTLVLFVISCFFATVAQAGTGDSSQVFYPLRGMTPMYQVPALQHVQPRWYDVQTRSYLFPANKQVHFKRLENRRLHVRDEAVSFLNRRRQRKLMEPWFKRLELASDGMGLCLRF